MADRFLALLKSTTLNGIDFVEIDEAAPQVIVVHFINGVDVSGSGVTATVDGGDSVPAVALDTIKPADWAKDVDGHWQLTLRALNAPDFSNYTLTLASPMLDRMYASTAFSFKVFCPSDFDCQPPPHVCPPGDPPPPIDYLAKDYDSFVRALSDFSALRYPGWMERSEADFGVMFMEALSALGDDLSYQQDRVAAEATLDTATELRSLARHARLVDYDPRPETVSRTMLVCAVAATALPAGTLVRASLPTGGTIPFEVGVGLADATAYPVDPKWNAPIAPYAWDDSQLCLTAGSTEAWLSGGGYGFQMGQALLIDTAAQTSADSPIRQFIHLSEAPLETTDPLFGNVAVTRIRWSVSEALARDHDLTRTTFRGNVVPATQGRRTTESFAIDTPPSSNPLMPLALTRLGANATPASPTYEYRYCLRGAPLAWIASDDPDAQPAPEIALVQPAYEPPQPWSFFQRLLEAAMDDDAFTIEAARYRRVATLPDGSAQIDYDGDGGDTILFGNGDFGALPVSGNVFQVTYRVGAGALGNVAADSITQVDPLSAGVLLSCTNPFAASGGADRETNAQIQRRAPQAFQARQFRAVRAEDYQTEAERLPWVQQAGTAFRWTGSWFTVFTAVDPKGGETLPPDEHIEVIELLNRRRLAGYESYVPLPRYVSIDLDIEVCALADAFRGDVERDVLAVLAPPGGGQTGFFFADHFTFGTPLERSRIEAAIQNVVGVAGVESIRFRRRALVPDFVEMPDVLPLAHDEILRIDNDASHPERGALAITVCGGK